MSQTIEFYRQRAQEAADEASAATLENVQLRARRSEAAWLAMADRATALAEGRHRNATESALSATATPQQPTQIEKSNGPD